MLKIANRFFPPPFAVYVLLQMFDELMNNYFIVSAFRSKERVNSPRTIIIISINHVQPTASSSPSTRIGELETQMKLKIHMEIKNQYKLHIFEQTW